MNIEPRDYQTRIITKCLELYQGTWINKHGHKTGSDGILIESPTGSGKTIMGLVAAKKLQDLTGCQIVWVAMRRNLLAQANRENKEKEINADVQMLSMYANDIPETAKPENRTQPLLLVVDECHHDATSSMGKIHAALQPNYTLGLTATPFRSDKAQLCFNSVIKDAGIHELIQSGYLAQYHHYTIAKWSPARVARHYLMEQEKWGKSLVFFHREDQCLDFVDRLRQHDVTCELVTAKTDRNRQLDLFESGEVKVLVNMAILTEGFDCPSLQTVFCRPSTKGLTCQMAGRVFRKYNGIIKNVVQCKHTKWPIIKTAKPAASFVMVDKKWVSLNANSEQVEIATRNSLQAIANAPAVLPTRFGGKRKFTLKQAQAADE